MNLSKIIDKLGDMPMLPLQLTENSPRKFVRVIGVIAYTIWFVPALFAWCFVVGLLAIPAMIQDA